MTTVTDPHQLDAITDLIHDEWFDVDAIVFDSEANELTIPFGARGKGKHADAIRLKGDLRVREAIAYDVDDRAHIGYYDFNEITSADDNRTVVITSSFPLQITVQVQRLRITVSTPAE